MNNTGLFSRFSLKLVKSCVALIFLSAYQIADSQSLSDYAAMPPTASDSTAPLVMLAMSRDNQLWHKAYNDYSDINGDGVIDTTYNDDFEYFGYFHSDFCYAYSSANNQFSPIDSVDNGTHQCTATTSTWSGNFMNWLTTTRIDVVRKVLYGGYRSVDSASSTILQRALIPSDNHAFVKIVRDADIEGTIADYTPISGFNELSFCNVTDFVNSSRGSRSGQLDVGQNPPRVKVAVGANSTWAGSESQQCQYVDEIGPESFSSTRPLENQITGIPSDSELVVRVEVCVDGQDRSDTEACREYVADDGTIAYKPYGLLQSYGEPGTYKFGLMTGSYQNNTQGGVLRKNIVFMGGENAADADLEIDVSTGMFINQGTSDEGIINTLNRLRIQGWDYDPTTAGYRRYFDCTSPGISTDDFLSSTDSGNQCRDWGNPISEIYLEALRYFRGGESMSATTAFTADDTSIIPGLNTATWEDPFTTDTACSECSIIVLSTGLNNFDGDQLGSASDLPGLSSASDLEAFTDDVGVAEGLDSGTYIIGEVSPSADGTIGTAGECDAKTIGSLSNARGPCPEVPSLQGSYNLAGAAFYAKQTDFRALEGTQNVSTYTVSLAESLPSFDIATGSGNTVTFVPTCRSSSEGDAVDNDDWRECSLVDLTVAEQTPTYGRFMIAWEDSSWGNDYDMDAYSVVEYCTASGSAEVVRAACPNYTDDSNPDYGDRTIEEHIVPDNGYDYTVFESQPQWASASNTQIQLRVSMIGASAGFAMKFGYTINGSSLDDDAYVNEIIRYGNYNGNSPALTGLDNGYTIWSENARIFTAASTTPAQLENPLWYAAKYGGFNEDSVDANDLPDQLDEWDSLDIFGQPTPGGDGIPDSYFPVSNPANLPNALREVFADIGTRASAGSAASVNAQTGSGEGAIYQAIYTPRAEGFGSEIKWFGDVTAFFLDDNGRIREDAEPRNGRLDAGDRALSYEYNEALGETRITAYDVSVGITGTEPTLGISELSPIWSASDQLDSLTNYVENRVYNSPATTRRYIFTAFDRDGDGLVIEPGDPVEYSSEIENDSAHAFISNHFVNTLNEERYLGFDETSAETEISNLVNYIRGQEGITGFRSRTLGAESYLLGDIINSAPTLVAAPADRYDLLYDDETYREYVEAPHISGRRNVVYVGSNDGMLHAFNAGFFDPATMSYELNSSAIPGDEVEHPLGSELWAYVPFNLLPHLQWLGSPNYPHVYYVDGPVKAFDVNIFTPDENHINGWGTIIVAGMRFGGGEYELDHDNDETTPDIATRSAYIVMDVTDPESPPRLLAEITHPDLGFTTAEPTVIKYRKPNASGVYSRNNNNWALVFGSGPAGQTSSARRNALENGVSDQSPRVFVYELENPDLAEPVVVTELPETDSFIGGFAAADWDRDYDDDAIYFGLVGGTPQEPTGKLKRGKISYTALGPIIDYSHDLYDGSTRRRPSSGTNLPFSATPLTFRDNNNDFWIFAGTGRFFGAEDNLADEQHYYFGIKEYKDSDTGEASLDTTVDRTIGTVPYYLVDTTFVDVFDDGQVSNNGAELTLRAGSAVSDPLDQFDDVIRFVGQHAGWKFKFRNLGLDENGSALVDSLESEDHLGIHSLSSPAFAGSSLILTAYQGTDEFCESEGNGFLYSPHFAAGAPAPFAPVGTTTNSYSIDPLNEGEESPLRVLQGTTLGIGIPSKPVVIRPAGDDVVGTATTCDEYRAIVQNSTSTISDEDIACEDLPAGRRGWREIPVNW